MFPKGIGRAFLAYSRPRLSIHQRALLRLNLALSGTVRDFLVAQRVPQQNVSAQGFGKNEPIADISTSSGRAQNRRVELEVSGAAIDVHEQPPGAQGMNGTGESSPATNGESAPASTNYSGR